MKRIDAWRVAGVCAAMAAAAAGTARGGDWPMYLGPNRNNVSDEKGLTLWQGAPKIAWKQNVEAGYSSVAVAGGRVYTMGGAGIVWCLDAATGAVVWRQPPDEQTASAATAGAKPGRAKGKGGETQATPAVSDGLVYAVDKGGRLACLEAAGGKPVWSKMLSVDFGAKWGGWAAASSPLIHGDRLILDAGQVIVLDKKTGGTVWKAGSDTASYASAMVFKSGNASYVTSFSAAGLTLYDLASGREAAKHPWKTAYDVNAGTPLVAGDRIFLSTGYGRGCTLLAVGADGLRPVYENKEIASHCQTCAILDGRVYGVHGQQGSGGSLKCLDLATGKVKWEQGGMRVGGGLTVADGKLFVLADGGELLVAQAAPDAFKALAKAQVLDGKCWTAPVVADKRVFCRNYAGDLACVGLR